MTFEHVLKEKLDECGRVMVSKQRDYGPGNISSWGEIGIAVRLNDKVERLRNLLTKNRNPSNESLRDTALDIANYGVILMLLLDKQWGMPLEEETKEG